MKKEELKERASRTMVTLQDADHSRLVTVRAIKENAINELHDCIEGHLVDLMVIDLLQAIDELEGE